MLTKDKNTYENIYRDFLDNVDGELKEDLLEGNLSKEGELVGKLYKLSYEDNIITLWGRKRMFWEYISSFEYEK